MNTTTKQAKDDPISDGYILVHNADRILREQIFTRRKALLDYGNDIAVAKARGYKKGLIEGALKSQKEIVKKLRENGVSEDVIRAILGDDY